LRGIRIVRRPGALCRINERRRLPLFPLATSRPVGSGFCSWEPDRPIPIREQVRFKVGTGRK
jgi:hypothetical protein